MKTKHWAWGLSALVALSVVTSASPEQARISRAVYSFDDFTESFLKLDEDS